MTNIPAAGGIGGVPGSHYAQFIDVLHREHAVIEDQVRTNKAMGRVEVQDCAGLADGLHGYREEVKRPVGG